MDKNIFNLSKYVHDRYKQLYEQTGKRIMDFNILEQIRFVSNILLEKSTFDEQLLSHNMLDERKIMERDLNKDPNYNDKIEKMKVVCSSYAKALEHYLQELSIPSKLVQSSSGHCTVVIPLLSKYLRKDIELARFQGKVLEVDIGEEDFVTAQKGIYSEDIFKMYNYWTIDGEIKVDNRNGAIEMPELHQYMKKTDEKLGFSKKGYIQDVITELSDEMKDEQKFLQQLKELPHLLKSIVLQQDKAFIQDSLLKSDLFKGITRDKTVFSSSEQSKIRKLCDPKKTKGVLDKKEKEIMSMILERKPELLEEFLKIEGDSGRIARYKVGFLSETLTTEKLGIYGYKGYMKKFLDELITPEEKEHMDLLMITNGTGEIIMGEPNGFNILKTRKEYFDGFLNKVLVNEEDKKAAKEFYYDENPVTEKPLKLRGLIVFKTKQGNSFAVYEEGSNIKFVGKNNLKGWNKVTIGEAQYKVREGNEERTEKMNIPYMTSLIVDDDDSR